MSLQSYAWEQSNADMAAPTSGSPVPTESARDGADGEASPDEGGNYGAAGRRGTQLLRERVDDLVLQREDVLLVVSRSKELPSVLARDVERAALL